MSTQQQVHEMARLGFNAATGQDHYDRARPSFPAQACHSILNTGLAASQGKPLRVIELGAGTGISTRALLDILAERNQEASATGQALQQISKYLIFEPSQGMRDSFQRSLAPKLPAYHAARIFTSSNEQDVIELNDGTFESFPLSPAEHGQIDIIFIAQAWHWAQDHQLALTNFARALKPGGCLALLWNLEDRDAAPWVARVRDAYEQHEKGAPQYRHNLWKRMYSTPAYERYFRSLPQEDYTRILPTTRQAAWDRVTSKSYISVLPSSELEVLKREYDEIMDHGDQHGCKWIDEGKGIFEYPYITNLFKFTRTDAPLLN